MRLSVCLFALLCDCLQICLRDCVCLGFWVCASVWCIRVCVYTYVCASVACCLQVRWYSLMRVCGGCVVYVCVWESGIVVVGLCGCMNVFTCLHVFCSVLCMHLCVCLCVGV